MSQDKFDEFFLLQNKAKTLEKQGNSSLALEAYLDIIDNYWPYNDFSYDRAVHLLEKKGDYDKALIICQKAIDKISSGDVEGSVQKYKDRLEKIQGKLTSTTPPKKHDYKFGFPGFRSDKVIHKILTSVVILAALFVSIPDNILQFVFLISMYLVFMLVYEIIKYILQKRSISIPLVSLVIVLVITVSSFSFMPKDNLYSFLNINLDKEGEIGLSPGTGESDPEDDIEVVHPEITEDILKKAKATIQIEPAVVETITVLEADKVNLLIYVQPSTSVEEAKRISEKFGKNIGTLLTTEGLIGSSKDYYGEIFEYYGYTVLVKDTFEEDIITGTLNAKNDKIVWTEAE